MKKSILNLGKNLNKQEQKQINGGWHRCYNSGQCSGRYDCCSAGFCIDTSNAILAPYCT
ncbi:hypothetical protein [Tenacibaculum sp. 190524A05c]|uniref:hypothetical protein n=1 Tax=Tenacibaculum platacis TaxID=3137852 RepID=UPI0032B2B681